MGVGEIIERLIIFVNEWQSCHSLSTKIIALTLEGAFILNHCFLLLYSASNRRRKHLT